MRIWKKRPIEHIGFLCGWRKNLTQL